MGAVNGYLRRWYYSWLTQAVGKPTWFGFHLNPSDLKTLEHCLTHVTGVMNLVRNKYTSVSIVITHAWATITYPGVKCEWNKKQHQATVSHLILCCMLSIARGLTHDKNKLFLQQPNLLMRKLHGTVVAKEKIVMKQDPPERSCSLSSTYIASFLIQSTKTSQLL